MPPPVPGPPGPPRPPWPPGNLNVPPGASESAHAAGAADCFIPGDRAGRDRHIAAIDEDAAALAGAALAARPAHAAWILAREVEEANLA